MKKYETTGGYVTRAETFAKLTDLLDEARSCCYVISHLHQTESGHKDELIATGWRAIGDMLKMIHFQVVKLGQGKLQ